MPVNKKDLVTGGILKVIYNECFDFYSSYGTNLDYGRVWVVWVYNSYVCRETPDEMTQVFTQACSALFVGRRPFLEDSAQQSYRWGLPGVWNVHSFWSPRAEHAKATLDPTLAFKTTNEAFIKVQL